MAPIFAYSAKLSFIQIYQANDTGGASETRTFAERNIYIILHIYVYVIGVKGYAIRVINISTVTLYSIYA